MNLSAENFLSFKYKTLQISKKTPHFKNRLENAWKLTSSLSMHFKHFLAVKISLADLISLKFFLVRKNIQFPSLESWKIHRMVQIWPGFLNKPTIIMIASMSWGILQTTWPKNYTQFEFLVVALVKVIRTCCTWCPQITNFFLSWTKIFLQPPSPLEALFIYNLPISSSVITIASPTEEK